MPLPVWDNSINTKDLSYWDMLSVVNSHNINPLSHNDIRVELDTKADKIDTYTKNEVDTITSWNLIKKH